MKTQVDVRTIDVDKAHYIYQKVTHCIEQGYTELALKYLGQLVDILVGEEKPTNSGELPSS